MSGERKLEPVARMMVRYVALGCSDADICVQFPEFTEHQVAKMRAGATFKRALSEMQKQIDEELIAQQGEDPVRAFLRSKGLSSARVLADLAENVDGETPHAVQAKSADSILAKAGFSAVQENIAVPVLMLSSEKLAAVVAGYDPVKGVPDCVDGHVDSLPGFEDVAPAEAKS